MKYSIRHGTTGGRYKYYGLFNKKTTAKEMVKKLLKEKARGGPRFFANPRVVKIKT